MPTSSPTLKHEAAPSLYPTDVFHAARMKDGSPVVLRSIHSDDAPGLARFHESLSDETVRSRYFHYIRLNARVLESRLAGVCRPDPQIEAVVVAVVPGATRVEDQLVGVGRIEEMNGRTAEISAVVSDAWQQHGIGRLLVDQIIDIARRRGLAELVAYTLTDNLAMQRLCQRLGFTVAYPKDSGTLQAKLKLGP